MSRQRGNSRKRPSRAGIKQAPSGQAARPVSPELLALIRAMARAATGKRTLTLRKVRDALQHAGVTWSREGELLFPQDRTALVIELDELIDAHGAGTAALAVVSPRQAEATVNARLRRKNLI